MYLFWLSSLNRKHHPTVVAASWEFAGLLAGLVGLIFCTGVLLSSFVVDMLLFSRSRVAMAWERTLLLVGWGVPMTLYFLLLTRSIRKSLAARRNALSVFNADVDILESAVDEALMLANCPATKTGDSWVAESKPVVEISTFPVFQHATLKLTAESPLRETLERSLRASIPKLPAAVENPAVTWITAACTCSIVAVACCVIIVFVMPFLPKN